MLRNKIKTTFTIILAIVVFLALGSFDAFAKAVAVNSNDSWYLVCQVEESGEVTILSQKIVQMQAPLDSLSETMLQEQLETADRLSTAWTVRLVDHTGKVVFSTVEWLANDIRADVASVMPGEEMKGIFFQPSEQGFVVRVPYLPNTHLQLRKTNSETVSEFDLALVGKTVPEIEIPAGSKISMMGENGPASNRADVLLMGDGFTQAQEASFRNYATQLENALYQITPLTEYANYFNTIHLFTPSQEIGADHPVYDPSCPGIDNPNCCRDPQMQNDDLNGQMRNTAFHARYCAYHMHRALVVHNQSVFNAAAAYPDWDTIIVIVNDGTYGGTGGQVSVISRHPNGMASVAQHELGHTFGKLADEYSNPYPGFPTCSDTGGNNPCEANVTNVNIRNNIKWKHWIDASTSIPTPPQSQGPDFVGLFEGARYFSTGMYRPGRVCLMQSLGYPFCRVPSEALVLRFYRGGWGQPQTGIKQIEPGSAVPEESVINLEHPATQTFSVDVLQPIGGPASEIQWFDGLLPIPGATGSTFTYETSADQLGSHTIRVVVKDKTWLVHEDVVGNYLTSQHSWTVNVSGEEPTPTPTATQMPTPTPSPTPTQPPVEVFNLFLPMVLTK